MIGIALIFLLIRSKDSITCSKYSQMIARDITGEITSKYIDIENHSYPTIVIKKEDGTSEKINLIFDTNNIYSRLKVSDFITKKKDQSYFIINEKDTLKIDYGVTCD